jgi:hypothetical protein
VFVVTKYFIVAFAKNVEELRKLPEFDLDLFASTAKPSRAIEEFGFQIDGLLTVPEIKKLVDSGYRVLIEDPLKKRARAQAGTLSFKQWLEQMEEKLKRQRLVA